MNRTRAMFVAALALSAATACGTTESSSGTTVTPSTSTGVPATSTPDAVPSGKWTEPQNGIAESVAKLKADGYQNIPDQALRNYVVTACNELGDGKDPVDVTQHIADALGASYERGGYVVSVAVVGACPQYLPLVK